ncbi:MAG: DoxX family protein [Microbacteriaceae bacterium]|jgi:putative oxidoreductase|nr:DoxX family protein [Microbacteriaceae bacterium]
MTERATKTRKPTPETESRQLRRARRRAAQAGSSLGLLLLRVAVGGTVAAHGLQNALGVLHGPGIEKTSVQFDRLGIRPARPLAVASGIGMVGGGAALALGLATPVAGAAVAASMGVAAWQHHTKGFFELDGGYEFPLGLAASGAALILTGPGRLSADAVGKNRLNRGWMRAAGLLGAAAATAVLIMRQEASLEGEALARQLDASEAPAQEG